MRAGLYESLLTERLRGRLAEYGTDDDRLAAECAFIIWNGVRLLEQQLAGVRQRGVPLRVITFDGNGQAADRHAI